MKHVCQKKMPFGHNIQSHKVTVKYKSCLRPPGSDLQQLRHHQPVKRMTTELLFNPEEQVIVWKRQIRWTGSIPTRCCAKSSSGARCFRTQKVEFIIRPSQYSVKRSPKNQIVHLFYPIAHRFRHRNTLLSTMIKHLVLRFPAGPKSTV